jgi:hypothetical protein
MGINNSFEKINYSLRPAKSIERKMILQFCLRLVPFDFVEKYHYIGFGSIYYSDFILFHKNLNISKMSSIEFGRNESRAKFNLPYGCIKLHAGESNSKLPSLIKEDEKSIAWLDYDSPLSSSALDDIQTFSAKSSSGSMLLVTLNANSDNNQCIQTDNNKLFEYRKKILYARVSEKKVPSIKKPIELNKKHICSLYRKIIYSEISETLNKRNKTVCVSEKILFHQIINFHYVDGAKMMTLGFIFYRNSDKDKFNACKFDGLTTYRDNEEAYQINSPKLTIDEIRALNKMLPMQKGVLYEIADIDNLEFKKSLEQYAEVYQYFPQFSELFY